MVGIPPAAATALPPVPLFPDAEFEAESLRRLEAVALEKLAGVSGEVFAEQKIDLIVMGTHGRTGVKHFLLGSVAERVVRESPIPVLTIHPKHAEN